MTGLVFTEGSKFILVMAELLMVYSKTDERLYFPAADWEKIWDMISIQFNAVYLYSIKSQQMSSQGTSMIQSNSSQLESISL